MDPEALDWPVAATLPDAAELVAAEFPTAVELVELVALVALSLPPQAASINRPTAAAAAPIFGPILCIRSPRS
ncbi:MAG: hypothetical protein ABIR83_10445 [Nakamurella sp.]